MLAWLLAGYFLSQYSQASSCIFSKNLVLELGLGVCGVCPVAESWTKGLDKWDVLCIRGGSPAAWPTACSL